MGILPLYRTAWISHPLHCRGKPTREVNIIYFNSNYISLTVWIELNSLNANFYGLPRFYNSLACNIIVMVSIHWNINVCCVFHCSLKFMEQITSGIHTRAPMKSNDSSVSWKQTMSLKNISYTAKCWQS